MDMDIKHQILTVPAQDEAIANAWRILKYKPEPPPPRGRYQRRINHSAFATLANCPCDNCPYVPICAVESIEAINCEDYARWAGIWTLKRGPKPGSKNRLKC